MKNLKVTISKKVLAITTLSLFSLFASAVESIPQQEITNIRVEGIYGFIGFSTGFSSPSTCGGNRVWVDLSNEVERIKYSTALAAFTAGKKVNIRANERSRGVVFGACQMYDIYVTK